VLLAIGGKPLVLGESEALSYLLLQLMADHTPFIMLSQLPAMR